MPALTDAQKRGVKDLLEQAPREDVRSIAEDALKELPKEEQAQVVRGLGLRGPSQWVSDWIWFLVAMAFVITMAGAVATLLYGRFAAITPKQGDIFTSTDTLITLFTTTTAFLAGLLAPSPVRQGGQASQ